MADEVVISLNNVSKCFKRYAKPIDRLKEVLFPTFNYSDDFWALRDINLEIPKGQTVGIIGRNGSGKSTLLQIIAKTLTATTGEVNVQGKVSALLELGSGFNPEFTGRQNVFFNGSLLGLNQKEVEDKFDEIVGFADIGDFIDQPVKTYSSGMFVRLAFAVAVNVNPDILIVDEALAVGDIYFQQKCFSRLASLKSQGTTLLFVSHDMSAVYRLCDRSILMDSGQSVLASSTKEVVELYEVKFLECMSLDSSIESEVSQISEHIDHQENCKSLSDTHDIDRQTESSIKAARRFDISQENNAISLTSERVKIESIKIFDKTDSEIPFVVCDQQIKLSIAVIFLQPITNPIIGLQIRDRTGMTLFQTNTYMMGKSIGSTEINTIVEATFTFKASLAEGEYTVTVGVANEGIGQWGFEEALLQVNDAYSFKVLRNQTSEVWFGLINLSPSLSIGKRKNIFLNSHETLAS